MQRFDQHDVPLPCETLPLEICISAIPLGMFLDVLHLCLLLVDIEG